MGRQTQRKSYRAVRRRKFIARRIFVLVLMLAVIGGLTWLLTLLISGKDITIGNFGAKETPAASETPQPTPEPTPTPVTELPETVVIPQMDEAAFAALGFSSDVMFDGEEAASFAREENVKFAKGDSYTSLKGITTFGGNNFRDTFTYGTQSVVSKTLERIWDINTGALDLGDAGYWSGTGWTGMPLIIQWDADVRAVLGVHDEFKNKEGFTEVIYPAMDGKIYFAELSTGKETRDPINVGVVMKGTATLDPRGYPLLYVGQGTQSDGADGKSGAWFRVISLIENKQIWSFGGRDPFSNRYWQSYDGSALICADTLIVGGENGVLYSLKLNASFDKTAGTVGVDPGPLAKYRYTASGYGDGNEDKWLGVEDSVAAWHEYVFFTDNGGLLQCVNINTLETVYALDVTDNSDSTIVLEEDPAANALYLYTANSVDRQTGISNGLGKNFHRKIDALTGKVIWEKVWDAGVSNSTSTGGTLSTPHVGRGKISDLVIFNSTLVPLTGDGAAQKGARLIAYYKDTGEEAWRYEQSAGYWSSPVVVYDEEGNAYVVQCDREGIMRLHDARTGEVLASVDLGSRIESTPAVFGNIIVVGTRGEYGSGETQKIIGVRIG